MFMQNYLLKPAMNSSFGPAVSAGAVFVLGPALPALIGTTAFVSAIAAQAVHDFRKTGNRVLYSEFKACAVLFPEQQAALMELLELLELLEQRYADLHGGLFPV